MDTPSDGMDIVNRLRGTAEERTKGVAQLFDLLFIRHYTVYWFGRYLPRLTLKYPEWDDLYVEVVLEFVKEVDAGRGPRTHFKAYLSKLCQNLCEKAIREIKTDETFDTAICGLLTEGSNPRLQEWVENTVAQLECKCETLLRWRYLQNPSVKATDELAAHLQEECGKEYAVDAIPVHLHDCRDKFRKISKGKPFDFIDSNP